MNVLILDSWLRDCLKTQAKPRDIARCLSLCGPSVERVIKKGKDWVYDIEITPNRPDMASMIGIAREAAAILPRFGVEAKLRLPPIKPTPGPKKSQPLKVKISPPSICPRFSAIILEGIKIKPSPLKIQYRLEKAGIRALNNIVDISNYLMIETGQPIHTFDYDKIAQNLMIVRLSQKGEKITTLDGITRTLPGGDIVIEDGKKRLIDLCGIMGGENTAIDHQTKKVLFFVQSYDPARIRRTSMLLAHRTEAAVRFEKGVDEESILDVIWQGLKMAQKVAGSRLASKVYDIYPNPYKTKEINTNLSFINSRLGIDLSSQQIKSILSSLGFKTKAKNNQFSLKIPSWRAHDISIPEDVVEEVARLYSYHNLPSIIPEGKLPSRPRNNQIEWEDKIKNCLKHWGFTEIYSYSMISKELLEKSRLEHLEKSFLKLANPLTEEWVYMRPSLIPSLLSVTSENQENFPSLKIFEMANTYNAQSSQLPKERMWLTGIIGSQSFYRTKGIVEGILAELGIEIFTSTPKPTGTPKSLWHPTRQLPLMIKKQFAGMVGEIHPQIKQSFGIKIPFSIFNLSVKTLADYASWRKTYIPIPKYPSITEDLSFVVPPRTYVGETIQLIKSTDSIIQRVKLLDSYKNTRTFRITYQSQKKTLTDKEVGKIREKIIKNLGKKFKAHLKGF